jgi:hypothetical protein
MRPFNNEWLSIYKAFLNVKITALSHMPTHLYVVLNYFLFTLWTAASSTQWCLTLEHLVASYNWWQAHHNFVHYTCLHNVGNVDSVSKLRDEGRLAHALCPRHYNYKGKTFLIECSDHFVPLDVVFLITRSLHKSKEPLLQLGLADF